MNRPCWCGEPNPAYSADLSSNCAGTGHLTCYCGGDICVCHWHGEADCSGCWSCEQDEPSDDDEDFGRELIQPGDYHYFNAL